VQLRRSLCTKVPVLAWRVAGIRLRRVMRWRSCVMRCAGSTGFALGVSSSPGILRCSPYTSSATDACRPALKVVPSMETSHMLRTLITGPQQYYSACLRCYATAGKYAARLPLTCDVVGETWPR
jgi:hypothetical protein